MKNKNTTHIQVSRTFLLYLLLLLACLAPFNASVFTHTMRARSSEYLREHFNCLWYISNNNKISLY